MHRLKAIVSILAACAVVAVFTTGTGAYSIASDRWPTSSPVPFYVNPSNADVSTSAATSALQAAMNVWNTQAGTAFRFSYAGQVSDSALAVDGRNVIIFRNTSNPDSHSAIATTYAWTQNGTRIDSDIVFWDGQYKLFTGSSGCAYTNGQFGVYIEDVATHELGHALGLQHSSVSDATMYPSYAACTTDFRSLAPDDIAGAKALYPTSTGNTAPSVTITAPASNTSVQQGTSLTFTGTATDSQDGSLTSRIAWSSSRDGSLGTGSGFTKTLSVGSHVITATVADNGGTSASQQVSISVTASTNTSPTLSISGPSSGTSVAQGTALTFTGSATDSQDGSLTSRIAWSSSRDGSLGTGSGFAKILTVGSHVITASVTDNGGLSASQQVSVTVTSSASNSAAPSSTLTAKGYKVKGTQMVDLAWSNVSATSVDVYRNGAKVATTANSGKLTDNIGQKGAGTFAYKVCGAGTSTCSNQVNVTF